MRVAFVSSFVPRKCGIATYTRDLSEALTKQGHVVQITAMENDESPVILSSRITNKISQNIFSDYTRAARKLNKSSIDYVQLQHEYGLFGGEHGEHIVTFAKLLEKPLITTFHTVLLSPTKKEKEVIQRLAALSKRCVVMGAIAKDRLENIYRINPYDIEVIPHGVPDVLKISKQVAKEQIGYPHAFLLMANNLISSNKGFEFAINALPQIVKKIPNLMFLIIGVTHPVVKAHEGEVYRKKLLDLIKKHALEKNVQLLNEYISLEKVRTFLAATDVYITPYLDSQQITSGTLSYAIGAGKACVSTPYIYAQQLLANDVGIIVPFQNNKAISDAIINLYTNPKVRHSMEQKARKIGKEMSWPSIAKKHVFVYKKVSALEKKIRSDTQNYLIKKPDLTYFTYFTDNKGIFQHAYQNIPDIRFGYATDDNARALIVAAQYYRETNTSHALELIKTYLNFLKSAQTKYGKFHTFLDFNQEWTDHAKVSDAYGRALWGVGYYLFTCPQTALIPLAEEIFMTSLKQIKNVTTIRNMAYALLGMYYCYKACEKKGNTTPGLLISIKKSADWMINKFAQNHDTKWKWFEEKITYDNFRLPQALFAAFFVTGNVYYRDTALKTLHFIMQSNYNHGKNYFDFIGQAGWYKKGKDKAIYDQQPLEASGAIDAHIFAYKATHENEYIDRAIHAFSWYFGKNRNHTSLYDKKTSGVFDGLQYDKVNPNEGSENIVCFLLSQYNLQEVLQEIKH